MKVKDFYNQIDNEMIKHYDSSTKKDYYVSFMGEVYSVDKSNKNKVKRLKKSVTPHGYLTVGINGKTQKVHRIVAKVFIYNSEPDTKKEVDHINNLKFDNRVSNLQWISKSDNVSKSHNEPENERRSQLYKDRTEYYGAFMYEDYLVDKFRGNLNTYNEYLEKNEEFYDNFTG